MLPDFKNHLIFIAVDKKGKPIVEQTFFKKGSALHTRSTRVLPLKVSGDDELWDLEELANKHNHGHLFGESTESTKLPSKLTKRKIN